MSRKEWITANKRSLDELGLMPFFSYISELQDTDKSLSESILDNFISQKSIEVRELNNLSRIESHKMLVKAKEYKRLA